MLLLTSLPRASLGNLILPSLLEYRFTSSYMSAGSSVFASAIFLPYLDIHYQITDLGLRPLHAQRPELLHTCIVVRGSVSDSRPNANLDRLGTIRIQVRYRSLIGNRIFWRTVANRFKPYAAICRAALVAWRVCARAWSCFCLRRIMFSASKRRLRRPWPS